MNSMERRGVRGVDKDCKDGLWRTVSMLSLLFKELFQIFFSNAINAAEFDAFELLCLDELQDGEMVKFQGVSDLFGCEERL